MKYIQDQNIIIEDPFVIRPGIDVTVRAKLVKVQEESWDMTSNLVLSINGFVAYSSIKGDPLIPYSYIKKLEYRDDPDGINVISDIEIEPFAVEETPITVNIYHSRTEDVVKTSKSALSVSESDAYNLYNYPYIIEKDGVIIPMSLIDIEGEFSDAESIESFELITDKVDRGLTHIIDQMVGMNSDGTLTLDINVLRKGKEIVTVSKLYDGAYLEIDYANGTKRIEIDNQECSVSGMEFFGMENVGDIVFITTSDGLYGFNKWYDYVEQVNIGKADEFHWSNVLGTDITYSPDDSIIIADGTVMNKYFIRHDFVYMDENNNKILFREPNPDFDIS